MGIAIRLMYTISTPNEMRTIIAIYILLGAVSSGISAYKETSKEEMSIGSALGSLASIALNIWFGVWLLLNN